MLIQLDRKPTRAKAPEARPDVRPDVLVLGHYDAGFAAHEAAVRRRGETSGDYRNLRNDFITIDGDKLSYLDVYNRLSGRTLHWTEMLGTAVAVLCSYLSRNGIHAAPGKFAASERAALDAQLASGIPVIALTTTLYLDPTIAEEVVAYVRQRAPKACIVLGGPLVENLHHNLAGDDLAMVLDDIGGDVYVLERQGEKTLVEVARRAVRGEPLRGLPNCFVRGADGAFEFGGATPENLPLIESAIDWSLFPAQTIGGAAQTRTAFGCPFKCTFCDYPLRAEGKWKTYDMETIEREMAALDARPGVTDVVFIDDTFNFPIPRFVKILEMMIRRKFSFRWYSYFRCNLATPEIVALMRESNCGGVFLGIESGDDHVLELMKKKATVAEYTRGIGLLNAAGIPSFASLIVGFPGETRQSVDNTIRLLNETRPTFFRGEIWYYNHRSPIHAQREELRMEGTGYRFRHATMDWEEACDHATRMFAEVHGSTWLPMYDVDFWSLPYLRGVGLSLDDVQGLLARCNELLAIELGLDRPHRPRALIEQDLRELCRRELRPGRPVPPAPLAASDRAPEVAR
jgi:p-methyltransferase